MSLKNCHFFYCRGTSHQLWQWDVLKKWKIERSTLHTLSSSSGFIWQAKHIIYSCLRTACSRLTNTHTQPTHTCNMGWINLHKEICCACQCCLLLVASKATIPGTGQRHTERKRPSWYLYSNHCEATTLIKIADSISYNVTQTVMRWLAL